MSNPRQRRAAATDSPVAKALLDAATDLLAEGGPTAATSRAIAERSGQNLGSITYYYGSKDQLLSTALVAVARSLMAPVLATLDPEQGQDATAGSAPAVASDTAMLRAVQTLGKLVTERPLLVSAYVQALGQASLDMTLGSELRQLHLEVSERLARTIGSRVERAEIAAWVRPKPMAQLIVALVNGVAVQYVNDPDQVDPVGIAQQFASLLLEARRPSA